MSHHSNLEPTCPLCAEKLEQAHHYMRKWFENVKRRHPKAHISCAWRGKEDQDRAFQGKKSKLPFPLSKHNRMINGKPCSLALDLFELSDEGQAIFSPSFYAKINGENEEDRARIRWGGTFQIRDYDHFEMLESVSNGS